ncbi:glycosyltransferase family 2 protein, partial [Candidatus Margulisiibacteriota bacterium]
DYPKEKLDIKFICEEIDKETQGALKQHDLPSYFDVIIVPDTIPRTKPKACNYGLRQAKGKYVVIYDAEDIPDPKQLKIAHALFKKDKEDKVICIQSVLTFYNTYKNYFTRSFTLEYAMWFENFLPGLEKLKAMIPLGGTSNHFIKDKLIEIGAWDPFNVTEDADLGMRIGIHNHNTLVSAAATYEEANSKFINWVRQRSRWIKGYMQTYLVYMRHPIKFIKQVGLYKFMLFQFVVGGTFLFPLCNPVLLFFSIASIINPLYYMNTFPAFIVPMCWFNLIIGNGLLITTNYLISKKYRNTQMTLSALMIPIYWFLMSFGGYFAFFELLTNPFYWQKTHHGFHLLDAIKHEQKNKPNIEPII